MNLNFPYWVPRKPGTWSLEELEEFVLYRAETLECECGVQHERVSQLATKETMDYIKYGIKLGNQVVS